MIAGKFASGAEQIEVTRCRVCQAPGQAVDGVRAVLASPPVVAAAVKMKGKAT